MTEEIEIWKPVKGFEEFYEVSNLGRVRTIERYVIMPTHKYLKKSKELKQFKDGRGYLHVKLYDGLGNPKSLNIHRIVALTFIPQIEGKNNVNHIDANKLNNNTSNLEWCTHQENMKHLASLHIPRPKLSGENSKFAKTTKNIVLSLREEWNTSRPSMKYLSEKYNIKVGNIWNIVYRKSWKYV